jgi:5-methylcytosine-specific restriction endonuclease McrA
MSELLKTCADCGTPKLLGQFYKTKGYSGGVMSRCKVCHNGRMDKRKLEHPERVKMIRKACMAKKADFYAEGARRRSRRWRKDNPQKNQANKRIHRARKIGNGGRHTEAEWIALCAQFRLLCVRCLKQKLLTRDHVVPLTWGGTDDISNIQPLCRSCNSFKGNRDATDYRKSIDLHY